MSSGSQGSISLERHVQHFRYAVATKSCPMTLDALQQLLRKAEERFQKLNVGADRV